MAFITGNKPNWARRTAIDNVTDLFGLTAAAGDALVFPELISGKDVDGKPIKKVEADFHGTSITIADYKELPIGSRINCLLITAGAIVYIKTAASGTSTWRTIATA